MCDRYFVVFPNKAAPPEPAVILNRALRNVKSEDVRLHPDAFFKPIYSREVKLNTTKKSGAIKNNQSKDQILRQNVTDIAKRTRNFGLLLTQFHWVGLLTLEQGRIIMTQVDDTLRGVTMYRMLLKRDNQEYQKFINSLHMTGNHEIANLIEAHKNRSDTRTLFVENKSVDCLDRSCKKRKGSADSGFGEENEVTGMTKLKKSIPSSVPQEISIPSEGESYSCDRRNVKDYENVHKCSAQAYWNAKPNNPVLEKVSFVKNKKEPLERKLNQKENRFSKFFAIFTREL